MNPINFCYWLQGFFELHGAGGAGNAGLSANQTKCLQQHLDLVFVHSIDPSLGDKDHVAKLRAIHKPKKTISDDEFMRELQQMGDDEPRYEAMC